MNRIEYIRFLRQFTASVIVVIAFFSCDGKTSKSVKKNPVPIGAIDKDDSRIVAWADTYRDYFPGENSDEEWHTPEKALGKAKGDSYDIVNLGEGGTITMIFNLPIVNGPGADFAVFGNAFSDNWIKLSFVEVSSDGEHFVRFANYSKTPQSVAEYGTMDFYNVYDKTSDYTGYAGVHRQGYGTLFDLKDLLSQNDFNPALVDVFGIKFIRLVDVVGDGNTLDTAGNPIYDPYPGHGSAGFNLEAISVLNNTGNEDEE